MHKAFILFVLSVLIFGGCDQREAKDDYLGPVGSIDESEHGRGLAGALDARSPDQTSYEEKIMKSAYAAIRVSNVSEAYDQAINLANKYEGVILNSSMNTYADMDEAHLLVKILPGYFMPFLNELAAIGKVESKTITEEDVTEEYYDIKARLANARKVQERLFGILGKSNRVEDILRVEQEIERVGEKIEVLEGKIKYFDSKVDFSRINLTMYRRKARFIDLRAIGQGFKTAGQFAVHFFFIIIWAIIIVIPLIAVILLLRPVIALVIKRIKAKK